VTSAALVMVAVFGAFALGSDQVAKQIGVGLAAAILIDATIIRGVLTPAAVALLGRWNWWLPDWAARVLRVEPSPLESDAAPEVPAAAPTS
jgi:RND superfamily putative drug exporter